MANGNPPSEQIPAPVPLSPGLQRIRRRRWFLWLVLLGYLPLMWVTQRITHSFERSLPVFFIWVGILIVVTSYSAVARCPRCRNYYHVNGMSLLYLRRCLHCQLPLNADRIENFDDGWHPPKP
ncbi:hypothetical protein GMSM_42410 [Geomonas sp. Red276]